MRRTDKQLAEELTKAVENAKDNNKIIAVPVFNLKEAEYLASIIAHKGSDRYKLLCEHCNQYFTTEELAKHNCRKEA